MKTGPRMELLETQVRGRRCVAEVHGDGPRTFVFAHGVLFDAGSNRAIAERLARRGHRVVLPDLLGHGRSERPVHAEELRLEVWADQLEGIIEALGGEEVVLGGTSLGANSMLLVATRGRAPLRGLVAEMPVLERGAPAAAAQFTPLVAALRYGRPALLPLTRIVDALPRTGVGMLDALLDIGGSDPRLTAAVLHGLFVGPGCPPAWERRRLQLPTLVIGHRRDVLHPMDDALALAAELPDARLVRARSVLEARTTPARITAAIGAFLDDVWAPRLAAADRA